MRTPPPPRIDMDELCTRWRIALDAVREALESSQRSAPPALPPDELHERTLAVTRERAAVSTILSADASDRHVALRRPLDAPSATKERLGLTREIDACVFDLDGVLTASADLHAAAWAETFDEFLTRRLERAGQHFSHFARFSRRDDYDEHVHAKPRLDGVRAFLASRGITLPEGRENDAPGTETVHGLANRKNELLLHRLREDGVRAFEGSRWYLDAAHEAGLRRAVVSSSSNTAAILARAGLGDLIDVRIDGNAMRSQRLRPKPQRDTLLAACAELGVEPEHAAAFETTVAGVEAARAARFALVVAVDRAGQADAFRGAGADVVVNDVADLLSEDLRA